MRFPVAAVAALAAITQAMPGTINIDNGLRMSSSSLVTRDDELPIRETCEGTNSKTKETWEKYNVGPWFQIMASSVKTYTQDIQKTASSWGTGLYSFYCIPLSHCSTNFDVDQCKVLGPNPYVYFILNSAANFNNWLESLSNALGNTQDLVQGMSANLVENFSSAPDSLTISAAPLVLASGVMGSIGALASSAGSLVTGAAGLAGGILGIGIGIIGLINDGHSIELEPKFNTYADVTNYLANATGQMQIAIESYGRYVLNTVPDHDQANGVDYGDNPRGLPLILMDGDFAQPIISDIIPDSVYISMFSAAITNIWNQERAMVITVPKDAAYLPSAPCETPDIFNEHTYCDDSGTMHILLKYPEPGSWLKGPMDSSTKDTLKDLPGIDKLGDYKMSIETVVRASENAKSKGGNLMEWNPQTTADFLVENNDHLEQFVTFNFPVCELTNEDTKYIKPLPESEDCDPECQIIYMWARICANNRYGSSGSYWPYDGINLQGYGACGLDHDYC